MSDTKTKKAPAPKKTSSKAKKADTQEETPEVAPARGSSLLPMLMIIVIIQIALAGFYAWKLEQTEITSGTIGNDAMNNIAAALRAADQRIQQLEEEMKALNDDVDAIDQDVGDVDMSDDLADLEERIGDVEIALEELDRGTLSDEKIAELIAAKAGIEALQQSVSSGQKDQLQAVAQLTALDQIAQGVQSGQSYAGSLGALNNSLKDQPELRTLAAIFNNYEDGGAPSMKSLQAAFTDAVDAYYAAASKNDSEAMSGIMSNLSKLISIRKVGDAHEGDDDASRIARAEVALAENKLKPAADELRQLSADAGPYFYEWLGSASDYISLRESITKLRSAIHANIQKAK